MWARNPRPHPQWTLRAPAEGNEEFMATRPDRCHVRITPDARSSGDREKRRSQSEPTMPAAEKRRRHVAGNRASSPGVGQDDLRLSGAPRYPELRNTLPPRSPVSSSSSKMTFPLTRVLRQPTARWINRGAPPGKSQTRRGCLSSTRSMSITFRSARFPTLMEPLSTSPRTRFCFPSAYGWFPREKKQPCLDTNAR